ncbi:MAG: TIGR00725 family protein [Candidatus Omnitrophica bacterium]|nr:TIGR00725 family protein [Candidatus Omnitrophota bacterium]
MNRKFIVTVIGGHKCDEKTRVLAETIGKIIAEEGAVLSCGGLGGIMEAACRGARKAGGLTIGIIPGKDKKIANGFLDIVIPTDMGYSRNTLVAGGGDMVVALPGEFGTLSEICFSLINELPVYGFGTWDIKGINKLDNTDDLRGIIKRNMQKIK